MFGEIRALHRVGVDGHQRWKHHYPGKAVAYWLAFRGCALAGVHYGLADQQSEAVTDWLVLRSTCLAASFIKDQTEGSCHPSSKFKTTSHLHHGSLPLGVFGDLVGLGLMGNEDPLNDFEKEYNL